METEMAETKIKTTKQKVTSIIVSPRRLMNGFSFDMDFPHYQYQSIQQL